MYLHKGTESYYSEETWQATTYPSNQKVNINKAAKQNRIAPDRVHWEHSITFVIFLPKTDNLNVIMRESQTARMKDILLKNWPVTFKSVNIMKVKKTLNNCLRLKEIKEIWSPNRVLEWTILLKHIFLASWWNLYVNYISSNTLILSYLCWLLYWGFVEKRYYL